MRLKEKGVVTVILCDSRGKVKDFKARHLLKFKKIDVKALCANKTVGTIVRPDPDVMLVVYKNKKRYPLQQVMDVFDCIKVYCIEHKIKDIMLDTIQMKNDGIESDLLYMVAHKCFSEEQRIRVRI